MLYRFGVAPLPSECIVPGDKVRCADEEDTAALLKYAATGVIKRKPQDFEVVELDEAGASVQSVGYCFPVRVANDRPVPSPNAQASGSDRPRRGLQALVPLNQLLPQNVVQALSEWPMIHPPYELPVSDANACPPDNPNAAEQLSLGCFPDKEARGQLRVSLRFEFPRLTTVVDSVNHEVRAIPNPDWTVLATALGAPDADALVQLLLSTQFGGPRCVGEEWRGTFLACATKADRRAFHHSLQRMMPPTLMCRVYDGVVCVRERDRAKRSRDSGDVSDAAQSATVVVHLVVEKCNVESSFLKECLSHRLGCRPTSVCFAGTKDRRAVTYQRVSVTTQQAHLAALPPVGVRQAEFSGAASGYWCIHRVQVDSDTRSALQLGALSGNEFSIVVCYSSSSNPSDPAEVLDAAATERRFLRMLALVRCNARDAEQHGFLNYFGPQRFGRLGAAELPDAIQDLPPGVFMLRGQYHLAVTSLMSSAPTEAKSCFASAELDLCRRKLSRTAHRDALLIVDVLSAVARESGSTVVPLDIASATSSWRELCAAAIRRCPFEMRQLWLHAAQSYLFNCALSRVAAISLRVGVGNDAANFGECNRLPVTALPLVGITTTWDANSNVPTPAARECMTSTLRDLEITPEGIGMCSHALGVPLQGTMRETVVKPGLLSVAEDLAQRTITFRFRLPSSSYATVFLRHVLGGFPKEEMDPV